MDPTVIVISGPSGVGKSTLIRRIIMGFPKKFGFSVSHTTRKPRQGEKDGIDYHFVDEETMKLGISNGEFVETSIFGGNVYGTSFKAIEDVQRSGKTCVLDIDIEGVKQIKETNLNAMFIFIKTPSLEELERRLHERRSETEETLKTRLRAARRAFLYGNQNNFNYIIENNKFKDTFIKLKDVMLPNTRVPQVLKTILEKENFEIDLKIYQMSEYKKKELIINKNTSIVNKKFSSIKRTTHFKKIICNKK